MPVVPTATFLSQPAPAMVLWEIPYDHVTEEERLSLQMILQDIQVPPSSGQLQLNSPSFGHP